MLAVISHPGNANPNLPETPLPPAREPNNLYVRSQCRAEMGTLEPSCSAGGNAKWCSSCGTVWWLLNTVNTELPKDPAISLLGIDPKALKTGIQTHTCTSMFCFEEPTGGASPRPSTEEWVHKRGPSARWARSSDARCPLLGGAPGTATPSGSCQPREAGVTRFLLYKTSRAGTASGTEQLVPTGGLGRRDRATADWVPVSFGGDENVLEPNGRDDYPTL